MEDVHVFEGVAYVPIKFIRDKQRDWVSAGWLSKQMAHMEMGSQIETYDCLFSKGECSDVLWAEWDVYWKLPAIASASNFRILDWSEGMSETPPPLLYAVAHHALAVPATSSDVECCFSSLKWVRDERQCRMKCETHRAAVMLHYNGSLQWFSLHQLVDRRL